MQAFTAGCFLTRVVPVWSAQPKPVGREGVDEYAFLEALSTYLGTGR
jgi:hypothetical protein